MPRVRPPYTTHTFHAFQVPTPQTQQHALKEHHIQTAQQGAAWALCPNTRYRALETTTDMGGAPAACRKLAPSAPIPTQQAVCRCAQGAHSNRQVAAPLPKHPFSPDAQTAASAHIQYTSGWRNSRVGAWAVVKQVLSPKSGAAKR